MGESRRARARGLATYCVAILILGGWRAGVLAGELAYGAGYSLTYETNPTKVSTNPVADHNQEVIAGLFYNESTANLKARLLLQAEARDYRRDSFPDDTYVYLDGTAVWSIAPKTLDWTIADRREETRVDLTVVDTPANRAITNNFSTGPDLTLRFGRATALVLGARYGQVDVEDQGKNWRTTGYARLDYLLSAASKVRLNYESSLIKAEPVGAVEAVRREDLYVSYDSRISPTDELTLEIGATRVAPDGEETPSRRRIRLLYGRNFSPTSGIRLSLVDHVSDTYIDFITTDTLVIAPPSGNDVYRTRGGGATYFLTSGRVRLELGGYTQGVEYETIGDDYDEDAGNLRFTWQQAVDFGVNANATHTRRHFPDLGRTDVETDFGVGATYQLSRTVRLVASGGYERTVISPTEQRTSNTTLSLLLSISSDPFYVPQSRR